MRRAAAALLACALAACAQEPQRHAPPALPEGFRATDPERTAVLAAEDWWRGFGDPQLLVLLAQAERDSPDVQAAAARLAAADSALAAARALRWPTLSFVAGPIDPATGLAVKRVASDVSLPGYELGLRAQYELDLWGRVRNGMLAAAATRAAQADELAAARIALRSAVATAWFDLRETDAAIDLETRRGVLAAQSAEVWALRQRAGRANADALDAAAESQRAAQARLAVLRGARASAVDALAVLVGALPQQFALPPASLADAPLPPLPPAGLPASLLARRPDLRAAEARLDATEAQAAMARAERLPQVGLTAELGIASGGLRDLVDGARGFAGAGPVINAPLFDGGRRGAEAEGAAHLADAEAAAYRKAVLLALAEVERALRAQAESLDQLARADESLRSNADQRQRAKLLLDAGRITRLQTLELDVRMLDLQGERLRALRARQDAAIGLHSALGGGWQ